MTFCQGLRRNFLTPKERSRKRYQIEIAGPFEKIEISLEAAKNICEIIQCTAVQRRQT